MIYESEALTYVNQLVLVHAATRGVFCLNGYLEERTQRRRRVQLDVPEVTELPQCELIEELFASLRSCHVRRETTVSGAYAREGGVVHQVQPLSLLDQGQTPVQVDDAHEHGLLDDLRQVCRTSQYCVCVPQMRHPYHGGVTS
jgi:hypothetical protein